jgi:hypothetical protein
MIFMQLSHMLSKISSMITSKSFVTGLLPKVLIPILAIIVRIYFSLATGYTWEDALITMRYVQNIVRSNGFVYNLGEHVLGTTTPGYTLVLAFLGWIGLDFVMVGKFLCILAEGASCLFLILIAREIEKPAVGYLAALLLALWPTNITFSISGMETSIVMLLMLSSFYAYLKSEYNWLGFLGGILILFRIDSILFLMIIALFQIIRDRRVAWRSYVLALVVILPWCIFAMSYFGSVIPNTIIAKSVTNRIPIAIVLQFHPFLAGLIPKMLLLPVMIGVVGVFYHDLKLAPLVLWFFAHNLVFIVAGSNFSWHYLVSSAVYFLLIGIGVHYSLSIFRFMTKYPVLVRQC